jgi:hypothetical protein
VQLGLARTIVDDLAYLTDSSTGLMVADITDPASPSVVGALHTEDAEHVVPRGDYAYMADDHEGRDSDGRRLGSGVFLYRLNTDGRTLARKLVMLE